MVGERSTELTDVHVQDKEEQHQVQIRDVSRPVNCFDLIGFISKYQYAVECINRCANNDESLVMLQPVCAACAGCGLTAVILAMVISLVVFIQGIPLILGNRGTDIDGGTMAIYFGIALLWAFIWCRGAHRVYKNDKPFSFDAHPFLIEVNGLSASANTQNIFFEITLSSLHQLNVYALSSSKLLALQARVAASAQIMVMVFDPQWKAYYSTSKIWHYLVALDAVVVCLIAFIALIIVLL